MLLVLLMLRIIWYYFITHITNIIDITTLLRYYVTGITNITYKL